MDNIATSEEWFMSTFEELKKLSGRALHQVDFKNFEELFTVIKEEKDCDVLLKHPKPQNLIGAAKNLWRSLAGVKWLF